MIEFYLRLETTSSTCILPVSCLKLEKTILGFPCRTLLHFALAKNRFVFNFELNNLLHGFQSTNAENQEITNLRFWTRVCDPIQLKLKKGICFSNPSTKANFNLRFFKSASSRKDWMSSTVRPTRRLRVMIQTRRKKTTKRT